MSRGAFGVVVLSMALLWKPVAANLLSTKQIMPDSLSDPGNKLRTVDSFGNDLNPPCAGIECPEITCTTPFELKTDGACCGYCWAPDSKVKVPYRSPDPYVPSPYLSEKT